MTCQLFHRNKYLKNIYVNLYQTKYFRFFFVIPSLNEIESSKMQFYASTGGKR